jgi:hypothetical protein
MPRASLSCRPPSLHACTLNDDAVRSQRQETRAVCPRAFGSRLLANSTHAGDSSRHAFTLSMMLRQAAAWFRGGPMPSWRLRCGMRMICWSSSKVSRLEASDRGPRSGRVRASTLGRRRSSRSCDWRSARWCRCYEPLRSTCWNSPGCRWSRRVRCRRHRGHQPWDPTAPSRLESDLGGPSSACVGPHPDEDRSTERTRTLPRTRTASPRLCPALKLGVPAVSRTALGYARERLSR